MKRVYKHESKVSKRDIEGIPYLNEEYFVRTIAKDMINNIPIEDIKKLFNFKKTDPFSKESTEILKFSSCKEDVEEIHRLRIEKCVKLTAKIEI